MYLEACSAELNRRLGPGDGRPLGEPERSTAPALSLGPAAAAPSPLGVRGDAGTGRWRSPSGDGAGDDDDELSGSGGAASGDASATVSRLPPTGGRTGPTRPGSAGSTLVAGRVASGDMRDMRSAAPVAVPSPRSPRLDAVEQRAAA